MNSRTGENESADRPQIRDYTLLSKIGSGSYGDVWLARSAAGGLRAVKLVYRSRFKECRPYEREFAGLQLFEAVSLRDRSQLALLHLSRDDELGFFYYVMELADDAHTGVEINPSTYVPATLSRVLKIRRWIPSDEALRIGCELARGLEVLHSRGLIHRDIKPSNIIFVGGRAKLADIGLVTTSGESGTFVGTSGYIPPEGPGDFSADIFAMGRVLYECATGRSCLEFPDLPPGFEKRRDREAFLELNQVLSRACAPDRSHRYAKASELLRDLMKASALSLRSSRRRERLIVRFKVGMALAALVALLATITLFSAQMREEAQRRRLAAAVGTTGLRVADEGDWIAALPWLASASHIFERDPSRPNPHLDQVATLLEGCPSLKILHQYAGHINDVTVSPDSRALAVAVETGEFHLWDLRSGEPLFHLIPWDVSPDGKGTRPAPVQSVKFSSDNSMLAVGSEDGDLLILDARNPRKVLMSAKYAGGITSLSFSRTGNLLGISAGKKAILAKYVDGRLETRFEREFLQLQSVTLSPSGDKMACSGRGQGVTVFDFAKGEETNIKNLGDVYATAFSAAEDSFFAAVSEGDVIEWSWGQKKAIRIFPHSGAVSSVWVSGEGDFLVTASRDGFIRRWSIVRVISSPLRLPQFPAALVATVSPNARFTVGGGSDGLLSVWDHSTPAWSRDVPADRPRFVHNKVWNRADLERLADLPEGWCGDKGFFELSVSNLVSLDASPGGHLARCYQTDAAVVMEWRHPGGGAAILDPLPADTKGVLAVSARHGLALCVSADDKVFLWSAERRGRIWEDHGGVRSHVLWAEFDPVRRAVAWATFKGLSYLEFGNELRVHRAPLGLATEMNAGFACAAFSRDGRWMAVGGSTNREEPCPILIYDLSGGFSTNAARRLEGHRDGIRVIAFSPDSKWLASGGEEGLALIWKVKDWSRTVVLEHRGQVQRLAFSENGLQLLTATRSRLGNTDMLKLWNVADGTPASPNVQVAGNISRVAYAPWLRAWVWGDGWTNKVEKLPTHLFSPAVHPAERQDLLRRALVISGRDVGRSQTEAPIVNSKRVAMYQEWRPAAIQSRVSGPEAETLASTRGSDSHAGTSSRDN